MPRGKWAAGTPEALRSCQRCAATFAAKQRHQKFCSVGCRKKANVESRVLPNAANNAIEVMRAKIDRVEQRDIEILEKLDRIIAALGA